MTLKEHAEFFFENYQGDTFEVYLTHIWTYFRTICNMIEETFLHFRMANTVADQDSR